MTEQNLPVLPDRGEAVAASQLLKLERAYRELVPIVDDVKLLQERRAAARALEGYLRDRQMQRPALAMQRIIEARIGQLLGKAKRGRPTGDNPPHAEDIARDEDRADFRLLARALGGEVELSDDEWRKSRRALVRDLRIKLDLMPDVEPIPEGRFRCIVADPPWQLDTGPDVIGGTGESGHDALAYGTWLAWRLKVRRR